LTTLEGAQISFDRLSVTGFRAKGGQEKAGEPAALA
jgi:hypothetical protein